MSDPFRLAALAALIGRREHASRLVPHMSAAWMTGHGYFPPPITGWDRLKQRYLLAQWWKQWKATRG